MIPECKSARAIPCGGVLVELFHLAVGSYLF